MEESSSLLQNKNVALQIIIQKLISIKRKQKTVPDERVTLKLVAEQAEVQIKDRRSFKYCTDSSHSRQSLSL